MPGARFGAVVVALALTAAGCSGGPGDGSSSRTTTASPTTTADPVTVCTNQLVYWAKDILSNAKDTGLDYQEMGLDGDQDQALLALLDAARRQQASGPLPPNWLTDQARAACTKLAAAPRPTTSSQYGWP